MKSSELKDYPEAFEIKETRALLEGMDLDSLEYFKTWIDEEIENRRKPQ